MKEVKPEPHQFTEQQRADLLAVWKKPGSQKQAVKYLEEIELPIGKWLIFMENKGPSLGEIKKSVIKLNKKLTAVRDYITEHPEAVHAISHSDYMQECDITKAFSQVSESIKLLTESANTVEEEIPVFRGPDVTLEAWLVFNLAWLWERTFNKKPAKRGLFGLFINELSKILGYDIGPEAINISFEGRSIKWPLGIPSIVVVDD